MRPFFVLGRFFIATFFTCAEASAGDSQLLLSFKASLPNPYLLQNWVPNSDPCGLNGFTCRVSRVSSIQLSSIPLSIDFRYVSAFLLAL
ncbi:hypothetical protein HRI_003523000 [Hibiscus trionum]|uniref:Leucine-rich repeat-containing N-terminal plant-type domain-containing protein n=1 Tax=Hibiscus trionum TaxID=183268 RepID=A0A9W7MCB9_HIBTR|nr:hypothetical protein HRI_003523000 [Hibiscus trionum]